MKKITLALFACIFSATGFAQFSENFDSGTELPAGWSVIAGGDTSQTWMVTDMFDYLGIEAHSGDNAATIEYDEEEAHDDYLVAPAITVAAGVNDYFSFWGRSLDPDYPEMIDVKLSTTGTDPADFTVTLGTAAPDSGESYYKFGYDLSAYVGQTIHIAFYSSTTNEFIFEVDDVVSAALPTCLEPTGFSASDVTDTSATLQWTASGSAFQIEYGPEGFTQGTGTSASSTTTSLALSDLDPFTGYDAYVRQDCGTGGFSEWVMLSFETLETPAANDECSAPAAVVPGVDFEAGAVDSTDIGATSSEEVPSCQGSAYRDVWFSVVVPEDGNITLETGQAEGSDNDDTVIVAYTGDCGSLTEIDCDDDSGVDLFSKLDLTGLAPGSTIYVAVWQYEDTFFGSTPGAFRLSAYNTNLSTGSHNLGKLDYYPNPVKDMLNLSYDQDITNVTVTNMLGQQVMAKTINASSTQLDLSALSQGTYAVRVNTADATKIVKVVKQ